MSDPQAKMPLYQAQGYMMGVLERSEAGDCLVLTDGHRLKVDAIRFDLRPKLEKTPPDENPRLWGVYPRTKRDGTVFSLMLYALPTMSLPLDFTVSGQVVYCWQGVTAVSIRRNQNPPAGQEHYFRWKPTVITLNGSLPELRCWQYWRLKCEWQEGRLVIVDGVKVADAPPRPAKAQPVLSSPEESPPVAEPLQTQSTFDLSRQ
jgi:hypothetical protein